MNFKEVLYALNVDLGQGARTVPFNAECSGYIRRIGPGVTGFQVGDAVIVMGEEFGFGSYRIIPITTTIVHKPDELSFEEAVTIPFTFITAYHSLYQLALLAAGERVLIHSACGGVGMAALQLAQLVGAEIFATAGGEEKRAVGSQGNARCRAACRVTSTSKTM